MIKIRNKRIALLLVLAMLATMFVGVGTSSADDTTYGTYTGSYLSVLADTNQAAGYVAVAEKTGVTWGGVGKAVYAKVTLPDGIKYNHAANSAGAVLANYSPAVGTTVVALNDADRTMTEVLVTPTAGAANDAVKFLFGTANFSKLDVPSDFSGDINATVQIFQVDTATGGIEWDESYTRTIAKVSTKSVVVTAGDLATVKAGTAKTVATVTLKEATPGTFVNGEKISIVCDNTAITFNAACTITDANFVATAQNAAKTEETITTASNAQPGKIVFHPVLDIPPSVTGDITLTVVSDNASSKLTQQSIKVATIGDNSGSITDLKDVTTPVMAGKAAATTLDATFNLTANTGSTIAADKIITLTLNAGKFLNLANAPTLGSCTAKGLYNDNKTVWYTVNAGGTDKSAVSAIKVLCDADVAGDIILTVAGDAGIEGTATVGKYVCPIITAAVSAAPQVTLLAAGQTASDLTITEVKGGALAAATVVKIKAPIGVTFSKIPTMKVTTGNMAIDTKTISSDGDYISFNVLTASSVPSTVSIIGIKYDLNKLALEGDVKLSVQDNAAMKVYGTVVNAVATSSGAIHPAQFVIGAASYKLNGVDTPVFAASYIKDSRTYLAIRDIGSALGIDQANIMWDATNNTVTLMKGDKVVQLKIGSKTLLINGASITMDVAPEVGPTDRTMLPAAFVAQAFGATASWDAATSTVTIK